MFHPKAKNRWQAFGIHLLISLVLFITMCTIIVVFWYPGVLFTTEGGWQGVRLIAGIDFVIGPILTLLVYNPEKPSLKFDLTVIGLLQATCIIYGMHVVNYSRPAVVAYADGIFYTTPLLRFQSRNIDISDVELLNGSLPVWVNIRLPEDKEERLKVKVERLWKGLETSVDLYEPYENALKLLPTEGVSLEEAKQAGITIPDKYANTNSRVYKLVTRYNNYAVLLDIDTGDFIEILSIIKPGEIDLIQYQQKNTQETR
ncbi:MAG: hypothetical protein KDI30_05060 [Pseudomonadales bacterium]|nr:hypothetical protein [Pseudomonadales bacterium]